MRMRRRSGAVAHGDGRRAAEDGTDRLLFPLFVFDGCWPGFSIFPVGHPAPRNRIPGNLSGILTLGDLAVPMAVVPADAAIGRSQIAERGCGLEEPERPEVSLLHAAAPDSDRVVYAAASRMVSRGVRGGYVCHRTGRAVSDFRSTAIALLRRVLHRAPAGDDSAHRQLYVLQPSDNRSVCPVTR
jgi:hypothetical protein